MQHIDPILMEVISNNLLSIAEQAGRAGMRWLILTVLLLFAVFMLKPSRWMVKVPGLTMPGVQAPSN